MLFDMFIVLNVFVCVVVVFEFNVC